MENITFKTSKNLFLEIKLPTWPSAHVRGPKHAYASTFLRTQLGFQKYEKGKFFAIIEWISHRLRVVPNPFFSL